MPKPLLILDLDETLIYGTETPLDRPEDFRVEPFYIYERPHLAEFILYCFSHFDVAVWTSASEDYAREITEHIGLQTGKLVFLWSRNKCTRRFDPENSQESYVKKLIKVKKFNYALENVLMIDDPHEKMVDNYGNHIHITAFEGDFKDEELLHLIKYLDSMKHEENYRKIEKRGWRK
jgi:RNA polymerase II subunit A small phosphatase-like protein